MAAGKMYNASKNVFKQPKQPKKLKKAKTKNQKQDRRIAKLENIVLKGMERKARDINAFSAQIPSTGYGNYPLFQVEQGQGHNQRNGDKVTLMSHNVSMTIAGQDTTNSIRVLFVVNKSTTAIDIADVLEYGSYTTHGDLVFSSPYKRRASTAETTYEVLSDKVYHIRSDQRLLTDKFRLVPRKNGLQCQFNSTGSVMPENYQLQILAISDSTAAGHPVLAYTVRSYYIDL
jgi:hypothetical protein